MATKTQTEGKMRENPFSWSFFSSCHSCSRRRYKSPTAAVCSSCLHCLTENRLWLTHASWLRDVIPPHRPYPHATESGKPLLSLSSGYRPRASPFLGGARARVDKLLTVKRRREHFWAFATWVGERREFRQQMRTGATAGYFGSPACLKFISQCSWGQQGSNPWPLGASGQRSQQLTFCVSATPGAAVRTQALGQGGPKQHFESWHITPKLQHLLRICHPFWDRVQLGIPSATSTPLLQLQEDCAYKTLVALWIHSFTDSSRVLWWLFLHIMRMSWTLSGVSLFLFGPICGITQCTLALPCNPDTEEWGIFDIFCCWP